MGQLVLNIQGLCVHMGPNAGLPAGVLHRVVAVQAAQPTPTPFGTLPAHVCTLSGVTQPLNRTRVQIDNALPDDPVVVNLDVPNPPAGAELTAAPHLTHYYPSMILKPSLHDSGAPAWAAAYLDIGSGIVGASMFSEGGIFTTWTVQTDGVPVLRLTPFEGDEVLLPVPSGTALLANTTSDATDKQADFVLNFLAAEGGIPPLTELVLPLPGQNGNGVSQNAGASQNAIAAFGTTTSCSNSQYP